MRTLIDIKLIDFIDATFFLVKDDTPVDDKMYQCPQQHIQYQ